MFATAKSIELIGLAALNVILAIVLSTIFLTGPVMRATADRLTTSSVTDFVNQMTRVSTGGDIFVANKFLLDHIADNGMFTSSIAYDLPNITSAERHLSLDKKDYINNVLAQLKLAKPEEAKTRIESIEIAADRHHASVITTSYQRGPMPIQMGEERQTLQVKASSYCEQAVTLANKKIVINTATCSTNVMPARSE